MIFCPPIRPCQRDNVAAELLADMLLLSSSLEDLSSFARNIQPGSRGESFQRLVRLDNILDARLGVLEVFDVPGKHGKSFVRHGGGRWGTVGFQETRTRRQARGPAGNSRPRRLDWACLSISRWTPRKLAIVSGVDHASRSLPEHRDATGFKFGSVVSVPGIS